LSQNTSFNVSAHPNAGLPNAFEYDETPEQMQAFIKEYLDDNGKHHRRLRYNPNISSADCKRL
jgi:methionine synthase I (cobalamin-dependent)